MQVQVLLVVYMEAKMDKYHKINSLYKRDDNGDFILGDFAQPEFAYLFNNEWVGTEKIDGTNIRIIWDGNQTIIKGKSDSSDIPKFLLAKLQEIVSKFDWEKTFPGIEYDAEGKRIANITLYGEGYGAKIQKGGGNYIPDGVDFILFDVKIGGWWLKREDVNGIAMSLGIKSVPVLFRGTLGQAIEMVKGGFKSTIGTAQSEGLVLVPAVDLFTRGGERIITKLKTRDFQG